MSSSPEPELAMPLLKHRTKIDAATTVAEIETLLRAAGGAEFACERDRDGQPISLVFEIGAQHRKIICELSCNADGVLSAMRGNVPKRFLSVEHARRVGWRILRDCVAAQLALVASGGCTIDEALRVFCRTPGGAHSYQRTLRGLAA